jgi:hypothetical protein
MDEKERNFIAKQVGWVDPIKSRSECFSSEGLRKNWANTVNPGIEERRTPRLSGYDFTAELSSGYQFSIDPKNVAATLRDIATRIESGEYLLQKARMVTTGTFDDYPLTMLKLVIYEGKQRLSVRGGKNHALSEESFICPQCGLESFNQNDVAERYCGNCHKFFPVKP